MKWHPLECSYYIWLCQINTIIVYIGFYFCVVDQWTTSLSVVFIFVKFLFLVQVIQYFNIKTITHAMSVFHMYCTRQKFSFRQTKKYGIKSPEFIIYAIALNTLSNCPNVVIRAVILNWPAAHRNDLSDNAIHLTCLSSTFKNVIIGMKMELEILEPGILFIRKYCSHTSSWSQFFLSGFSSPVSECWSMFIIIYSLSLTVRRGYL